MTSSETLSQPASRAERRGHQRVVYVSYDGMEEPLGQSQVLPYLRGLAARGHTFELLSFEKPPARLPFRKHVSPGIHWTGLRYHKRPTVPATALDISVGAMATAASALFSRATLVHCRSYVAALQAMPYVTVLGRPLLFDMRGLWADERVEDGSWPADGRLFKGAKRVETLLLTNAAAITVLTNSMADYLRHEHPARADIRAPIHVIPTCTDLDHFRADVAPDPEVAAQVVGTRPLLYLGALGGRYRMEEMARFYLAWRKVAGPTRFLVVSRQTPDVFRRILSEAGVESELIHLGVPRARVPAVTRCAVASVFMYQGSLAVRGVAPTKLGEVLACGLPMAGNGVGDVPQLLDGRTGVVVDDYDDDTLLERATTLNRLSRASETSAICRAAAERWFSLEAGLEGYDALYRALADKRLSTANIPWPPTVSNRTSLR